MAMLEYLKSLQGVGERMLPVLARALDMPAGYFGPFFENEPHLNSGFLTLKNVVLAPHIGSSTEATRRAMAMTAAKNAEAALAGATPPNLINPQAVAHR